MDLNICVYDADVWPLLGLCLNLFPLSWTRGGRMAFLSSSSSHDVKSRRQFGEDRPVAHSKFLTKHVCKCYTFAYFSLVCSRVSMCCILSFCFFFLPTVTVCWDCQMTCPWPRSTGIWLCASCLLGLFVTSVSGRGSNPQERRVMLLQQTHTKPLFLLGPSAVVPDLNVGGGGCC